MPAVPDPCECGSRLFRPVWGVRKDDPETPLEDGNKVMRRDGFECIECNRVQLTQEIPGPHAENPDLEMPKAADRDLVREH